jgi:hypothetical protein
MFVRMACLFLLAISSRAWAQDPQALGETGKCLAEGISWGQIAALKAVRLTEKQATEQLRSMPVVGDPVLDPSKVEASVREFYSGTESDPRVVAGKHVQACMALRAASIPSDKAALCFVTVYEAQLVFGALANGADLDTVNAGIDLRQKAGWLSESNAAAFKRMAEANKNKGLDGAKFELINFVRCLR